MCASMKIRGYTLIESAIVLSVVGLLTASFFSAYTLYLQRKIQTTMETNATLVTSAMSNFLIQKGRLPCPARIDALRTDADYGVETQCDPAGVGYPAAVAGTFVGGLAFEDSLTEIDIDPSPTVANIVIPKVRRGGIPFRTLALPEDMAFDGYGNRFSYAVTEPQATVSSYQKGNGGIMLHNAASTPYFRINLDTDKIYLRPESTPSGSSSNPAPVGTLHLKVDEVVPNNGVNETIWSNNTATMQVCFTLNNPTGIIDTAGNTVIRFGYAKYDASTSTITAAGSAGSVDFSLYANNTCTGGQIGPTYIQPIPASAAWQVGGLPFASSLITDWNNLSIEVRHNPAAGAPKRGVIISYLQLEVDRLPGVFMDYFLSSAGKDQAGAYTREGKLTKACPAVGLDAQNCNLTAQAIYRMTDRAEAAGASHFDDFVKFFNSVEVPLWRVSGTGAHIRDLLNVEVTGGKIAIAQAPDMAPAAPILQVGGEVRAGGAVNADAWVGQLCDINDTNCFPAANLADPAVQLTDFTCPAGQFAAGFEFGKIKCSPDQNIPCNAGQVVTGIQGNGQLECKSVVGCPAVTIPLCTDPVTGIPATTLIPSGIQGQTYTSPSSGFNRTQTWTCGPSPWWQYTSSAGICNCTPVDETYDVLCNSVRTGNWTGNVTMRHTHSCPSDADNVSEVSNNCVCVDFVESYTDPNACGPGFSGSIVYERTWSCSSGTAGTWSSYTVAAGGNTCVCNPQAPDTRTLACPAGSAGVWQQERTFQCPAGTWTGWSDTTNTCACQNGQADGPYPLGCPAGYTGNKSQTRYYNCSLPGYDPWVVTDACICTPQTETQDLACPTAFSGGIHQTRDFQCPSATYTAWTTTPGGNTCACTGASEYRTIACTAPLAGTKDQRRDYDCGANAWGIWIDTANNCYVQSYNWTPKVAASGTFPDPLPVRAGDTCTVLNASAPCSAQAGGGMGWLHYAECKCE